MTPKLRRSRNVAIDGGKLTTARLAAQLTQMQLATKAGISQSYISGIELGERTRVRPLVYARLCNALDLTEGDLRADPVPTPPPTR
jgi:transcriptional regulator with XRE-family HTH domain